jgi:hypothetical protein
MPRLNAALLDQISDFARDYAGFAAARARQYQQWAVDVFHGFALTGIE